MPEANNPGVTVGLNTRELSVLVSTLLKEIGAKEPELVKLHVWF
jgi:hypothetical protein